MTHDQIKRVIELIDTFALEMKARILTCNMDSENLVQIKQHLELLLSRSPDCNWIDIANLSMLIWSQIPTEFDETMDKTRQTLDEMKQ